MSGDIAGGGCGEGGYCVHWGSFREKRMGTCSRVSVECFMLGRLSSFLGGGSLLKLGPLGTSLFSLSMFKGDFPFFPPI